MLRTPSARTREHGKGQIGSIFGLLVFLAVAYATWNVLPIFITDFAFKDKLNEMARLNRAIYPDEKLTDMIMKEVRERELYDYIGREDIKIHTVESSRRIYVKYERTVKVLPGWEKTFEFVDDVDQPLVF